MRLFTPGPVDVREEVLKQLGRPMIHHRGEEFRELLEGIVEKLRLLMYTRNRIFIAASSATGFMEAAIRNCVTERCLCLSNGAFGERWYRIAISNGKQADLLEVEWGSPITPELVEEALRRGRYDVVTLVHNETSTGLCNPLCEIAEVVKESAALLLVDAVSSMGAVKIEVDRLGIDVCLFGTQKALALPPGLAICSVSEEALERAGEIEDRGYYFDFLTLDEYLSRGQTPTTPPLPQLYALEYQLNRILDEGLENRYLRHRRMAELVRDWAKRNFELFCDETYASNTVTCVKNTRGINLNIFIDELKRRGYLIANGYGKLRGKTFRIGHMGDITVNDVKSLLREMDDVLNLYGV